MAKNHLTNVFWGPQSHVEFAKGLQQAINQVAPIGIYVGDNLFTFARNLGFLDDPEFAAACQKNVTDPVENAILWRTHVVAWAARQGLRREGDFVECGCYKGTTAKIVCDYLDFAQVKKQYFLYDLFEHDPNIEQHAMPEHGPDLYERTAARFREFPNVTVKKGHIPDVFKEAAPEKISFMHIDLNGATAELAALEHLFERMVPGAILILDDYGWAAYAAQKQAEDPFFAARGYQVLELPTGQGMVLK